MADDYEDLQEANHSRIQAHSANGTYDLSCITDNETFALPENALVKMPDAINVTFIVLYTLMLGVAVVSNSLAICVTYRGKHRLLYRCCLTSLACSDLMIAVSGGLANFPKFILPAHNYWAMGQFLCYFLPFMQTMSVLANSMTLSCIAVDRYLVVTQAMRTYWDPSGFACIACVVTIWMSSAGVAFPMYGQYMWATAAVINESQRPCYIFHLCTLQSKEVKNRYFIAVFTIIFLPLLCTFIVLYCLVMRFLWTRKRPGASKPFIAPSSCGADTKGVCGAAGARDSRKTRTVKAILALMVTFVCLRMPSWVFLLYSSRPNRQLAGLGWWLAQNVCSMLVVLNSAINPFFYCFLTQVMSAWDSMVTGCCHLAGRASPSPEAAVPPTDVGKCVPLHAPPTMIPRGPYSVQEPSGETTTSQPCTDRQDGSCTISSSLNSSPRPIGKDSSRPRDPCPHPTF